MAQDRFFHDIRNRLTVARGFVQLLLEVRPQRTRETEKRYLELIEMSLENACEILQEHEAELRRGCQ